MWRYWLDAKLDSIVDKYLHLGYTSLIYISDFKKKLKHVFLNSFPPVSRIIWNMTTIYAIPLALKCPWYNCTIIEILSIDAIAIDMIIYIRLNNHRAIGDLYDAMTHLSIHYYFYPSLAECFPQSTISMGSVKVDGRTIVTYEKAEAPCYHRTLRFSWCPYFTTPK